MLEALTVYYLAAASLLSSRIIATAANEIDEIESRFHMLADGKEVKRSNEAHLEIKDPEKYLATSREELQWAADEFCKHFDFDARANAIDTYEQLKDDPDFRLDRIESIMVQEQSLPF